MYRKVRWNNHRKVRWYMAANVRWYRSKIQMRWYKARMRWYILIKVRWYKQSCTCQVKNVRWYIHNVRWYSHNVRWYIVKKWPLTNNHHKDHQHLFHPL
jgi:hypothetical protein